ncbi:MAG: sigma-54-dependent transcriptional regulator [Thermoguttaceae bacterium]
MKILFADDEVSLQKVLSVELEEMGHTVTVCPDGTTALAALQHDTFDCLLVDFAMPGATGLEVVAAAKEINPDTDAILMTGHGTMEMAVGALRQGVYDYLSKPCRLAEIEAVLKRVAEKRDLKSRCAAAQSELRRVCGDERRTLIGSSDAMQRVQRLIDKLAPTHATVVILGETGTGKELVARALHDRSTRRDKPFVAINCGALPEALIESELFGHRKGSFTGADEHRTGLFQVAAGGTLFLDEIGELPKGVQAKLLRFLESGEIRKVGENASTICDVRVVCATLRNLSEMVAEGTFREDLWFRINTFEIQLPPLRERLSDIDELAAHFLARYLQTGAKPIKHGFDDDVMNLFKSYRWPGNVRQLANIVEHAVILSDTFPMGRDVLPAVIRDEQPALSLATPPIRESIRVATTLPINTSPLTLRELEQDAIVAALERSHGNKVQAASELGISLKTLYNKLNQSEEKKSA